MRLIAVTALVALFAALLPSLSMAMGGQPDVFFDQNALPKQAKAKLNDEGQIVVKKVESCQAFEEVEKDVPVKQVRKVNGKGVEETVMKKVVTIVCKTVCYENEFKIPAGEATFFDLDGKPISADAVAKALKKETTILYATRMVPNYYLSIFKPGTLVLKVEPQQMYGEVQAAPAPAPAVAPVPAPAAPAADPTAPAKVPAPAAPATAPKASAPTAEDAAPAPAAPATAAPAVGVPVGGDEPAQVSVGAPPTLNLAKGIKNKIALRTYVKLLGEEAVPQTVEANGEKKTRLVAVETESVVDIEKRYPSVVLKVYRADGKAVPAAELPTLFAASRCVLVSVDGKDVDKAYLEIVKPDTLIVVPPLAQPPMGHGHRAMPAPVPGPAPAPGAADDKAPPSA